MNRVEVHLVLCRRVLATARATSRGSELGEKAPDLADFAHSALRDRCNACTWADG
jgi:hypothetical protein